MINVTSLSLDALKSEAVDAHSSYLAGVLGVK
jgi:hypothetical protein